MIGSLYRALFVIVVALPFLLQAVPTPGAVPLFLPIAVLLLPATLLLRIAEKGSPGLLLGDPQFMAIVALTVLTYVYGFIISTELQYQYVFREVATGIVAMLVVFSIANAGWTPVERNRLVRNLAVTLLLIGLLASVLGAYKLWQFVSVGEQLGFVVAATGNVYPWGTSLVSDYNFYSLTVLAAILSALMLTTHARAHWQFGLVLLIAFMFVVGALAGSRRFWLVAPLILTAQLLWMISRNGMQRYRTVIFGLTACLIAFPAAIYVIAADTFELVLTQFWDLEYRFRTIFDTQAGFGMGSRYDYMEFGIARLDGLVAWFGSGFDYLNRFSCEFSVCGGAGYPHMPIISAFLYGGVIAAVAALAMYVYITVASFRLLSRDLDFGWLFFPTLGAFSFAAISANGPLSIRSHVILGAACVGFLRAIQIDETGRGGETVNSTAQ